MADGAQQSGFNFPRKALVSALRPGEIVVDLFAGGGGASEALKQALGRDPDLAYNHDELAVGLHAANHPFTVHKREDTWIADPRREVGLRPVGWFHASPDCTHFSQAKGGQPRSRATRSLSWVVLKWAGSLARTGNAPRIISLENVEQILSWGPLIAKRCKTTGRVIKLDGSVAEPGEQVSVWQQALVPDKRHAGRTWGQFVAALRGLGYVVEWRKLIASDYGAGTSRKRLFLIARRDGDPIVWPAPTHGKAPGLLPLVTAADCIDFTIPCPSIFTRKKPLADATMRRIAKGVKRYVIDAAEPFIVGCGGRMGQTAERPVSQPMQTITSKADACLATATIAPLVTEHANASNQRTMPAGEPLRTICAQVKGEHFALAAAHLIKFRGDSQGSAVDQPMPTITSGAGAARPAGAAHAMGVITAFLEQANGGYYNGDGHDLRKPAPTICGTGSQQRLVTADLASLSPEHEAGALRVAAFLVNYYGNGQALDLREPVDTITTRDRLALVTVLVQGTPYVIVDIGLRMLRREELFRAQGFPPDYIIDTTADGRKLSISASVRMVGNSVSPPPLCAIARANLDPVQMPERIAA
ncbi:DNA cytosine methyltransferase [Rhodanobacter thiooxydans]|uniref:DNA cytosine methyltransferase n=1 Tax=Rhodanobacter thiooxydans TaxID=416169 RepID=UPI000260DA1B|nr:DNA cytosine methyltransferase [Rhodanobacter thiooxydans]EIL99108.1 site-specific DNA methylase [Rhodanobacter thiooxydans LCS2]